MGWSCGLCLVQETLGLIKDVGGAERLELCNRKCDRCLGKRRFDSFQRLFLLLQRLPPSDGLCRGLHGDAGAAKRTAGPDLATIGIAVERSRDGPDETEKSRKVGGVADRVAINED